MWFVSEQHGGRYTEAIPHLNGAAGLNFRQCMIGPSGGPGVVISTQKDAFGYYPKIQKWHDCGDYWFGWDDKPTPESLARPKMIMGQPLTLNDGNEWLIPVARRYDGSTCLEQVMKYQGGKVVTAVVDAQKKLYDFACDVWDKRWAAINAAQDENNDTAEEQVCIEIEDVFVTAAEIIGINYYVSVGEISALELITTENLREVFDVIIDWRGFIEMCEAVKKNAEATGG